MDKSNKKIQDLRAELVVFLERIQQLEDENKRLKDDNDIFLDKIEELKSQSSLQNLDSCKLQKSECGTNLDSCMSQKTECITNLDSCKIEKLECGSNHDSCKTQISDCDSNLDSLTSDLQVCRTGNSEKQIKIGGLEDEVDNLKEEIKSLQSTQTSDKVILKQPRAPCNAL